MKNTLDFPIMKRALDWAYEKALIGVHGMDSAVDMAQKYMKQDGTTHEKVNSLIRWQNAIAGGSGFITGIGGFMTLPVAIPANLASVLYIQIRMIAAIAYMGGFNLREDKVKTLVFMCLVGNIAKDIVQETGIRVGTTITAKAIGQISEKSLLLINERVGFRLLSACGSKGMINLAKAVPVVGGLVGGSIDVAATNLVGNMARKTFINNAG